MGYEGTESAIRRRVPAKNADSLDEPRTSVLECLRQLFRNGNEAAGSHVYKHKDGPPEGVSVAPRKWTLLEEVPSWRRKDA